MRYSWITHNEALNTNYVAMVCFVNPSNIQAGTVNEYILRHAGTCFHDQLPKTGLQNLGVHRVSREDEPTTNFRDVIFVVDTNKHPVDRLVYNALVGANTRSLFNFSRIALPLMRTDYRYEKNMQDIITGYLKGLNDFNRVFGLQTVFMNVDVIVSEDVRKILDAS